MNSDIAAYIDNFCFSLSTSVKIKAKCFMFTESGFNSVKDNLDVTFDTTHSEAIKCVSTAMHCIQVWS